PLRSFSLFFYVCVDHSDLHSFPTRRSSDLSETLSVGAYASKLAILRKSLTAWPALPALPPTPRMKRRPPLARDSTMMSMILLTADRKSTRLNSSHVSISYAVFCLKKKTENK